MGRVRHPCPVVLVVWLVFVGGLGGITTIGAALRRVVGVSGVYGRKTPRVLAQSAVHFGEMRVTWGVWGVVDYVLGVVASPCGVAGSARAVLGVFQWVRPLPMSGVAWWLVVWLVFVGGLGGIATIGAALRRVAGVSGVYGRKTPRVLAWKGQRRGPFRWRCGRLARAATCGVNVRSGGSCYHLTRPATTCDAQAARSGLGVRQERSSHHSHHSQRPQNPEWVRMSLGTLEGP